MGLNMPAFPFETSLDEIRKNPDSYIDAVFSCLRSEFLVLPKGAGFIEYSVFERGYEALKTATAGFSHLDPEKVFPVTVSEPISIAVLRSMLGFTPSEWGYVATRTTGIEVSQGTARSLDRKARMAPEKTININDSTKERLKALVKTACQLLAAGIPDVAGDRLHRLDKADTRYGIAGIQNLARLGVPYSMLLYERFLGRPFAAHRDSVSERIGGALEAAIEDVLSGAGVSYRKTKRAERIEGFDQAPDFIVPSEFNPQVIIEAKITEDDGTARDKGTRVQHLEALSRAAGSGGNPKYAVIACIGGRGFKGRREDMMKMIVATRGKVFTADTLNRMIDCTRLSEFRSC